MPELTISLGRLNKMRPEEFYTLEEPRYEDELQIILVNYIRRFVMPVYPDLELVVNPFTGLKANPRILSKVKLLGMEDGQSDLMLLEKFDKFNGLVLELKTKRAAVDRDWETLLLKVF